MRINYNISSIIARNALNNNDNRLSNSVQRLSSGLKINSAKDDAAGLAISRKMNAQIKGLEQANRNANDGVSVVNTADGAMAEMHDILQRMNELAIQSANGTNSDVDRDQIQMEIDQLVQELDRIADTTQFNAQNLLDGSFAYKGYTNTENVKVMSYTDGVASGTYAIGQLTYYRYEDTVTYKDEEKKVKHTERYEVSSEDDVKNALITSDKMMNYEAATAGSTDGYKAFPDGAKVTLDDENIIIKAENDFEVKITLNNRGYVDTGIYTTSTSTYMTTDCYKNVVLVEKGTNDRCTIKELNIETTQTGTTSSVSAYYTSSKEVGLRDLITNDFADLFEKKYPDCAIEIENADFTGETFTLTVTATDKRTGNVTAASETITFELYQERNENGHTVNPDGTITDENGHIVDDDGQIIGSVTGAIVSDGHTASGVDENGHKVSKTYLEDYRYSTTKTTQTMYTIGGDANGTDANNIGSCIELDLTGMGPMVIQVGANEGQILEIEFPALNTVNLGVDNLDISTEESATKAIDLVGNAINQLSSVRAKIGAYANRLERTITNLDTSEENMTAAYSRIMDVDVAEEMTEYSTVQVLVQSSTAMLAQANERPQQVLQLLQ